MYIYYCIIVGLITLGCLCLMVNGFLLLREKRNEIFIRNKKSLGINLSTDINTTLSFLTLCQTLIDNEIGKLISKKSQTQSKYEFINLDKDVSEISDIVFKSLKEDVLLSDSLILTDDFIMTYIIKETLNRLMTIANQYNDNLRTFM